MDKRPRVHFIGIGGAGMSGLAEIFYRHGYMVQGSDIKQTKVTKRLEALGIKIVRGHTAENIAGSDYVVYSSCIKEDNPEIQEARRKNKRVLRRIEALNMLVEDKDVIAISGAHGKTTTSSLIAYLLMQAGFDPTILIGADVHFLNGNAHYGKGNLVVTEADESDGSFLLLDPLYAVSTNVDFEHMDYYVTMDRVIEAYRTFIDNTKDQGAAFVCGDDVILRSIIKDSKKKVVSYGISKDVDIRAENIKLLGLDGSSFDVFYRDTRIGNIKVSLIGMHNVINSLAAIGVAMELGIDFCFIREVIVGFKGAERRFNITHMDSDILVIDDYAHHPTEIKATLKAFENSGKRIVVIFQPHRYTRTRYLMEEFGKCFDLAHHVVITDIYSAFERPIEGVTGLGVCDSIKRHGHKDANFVPKDDIIKHLKRVIRPGDVIFVLGAGDIDELPKKIVEQFEKVKARE